jgi:hypothetical protein
VLPDDALRLAPGEADETPGHERENPDLAPIQQPRALLQSGAVRIRRLNFLVQLVDAFQQMPHERIVKVKSRVIVRVQDAPQDATGPATVLERLLHATRRLMGMTRTF